MILPNKVEPIKPNYHKEEPFRNAYTDYQRGLIKITCTNSNNSGIFTTH